MFIRSININKFKIVKLTVNITKSKVIHSVLTNITFKNAFSSFVIGNSGVFLFSQTFNETYGYVSFKNKKWEVKEGKLNTRTEYDFDKFKSLSFKSSQGIMENIRPIRAPVESRMVYFDERDFSFFDWDLERTKHASTLKFKQSSYSPKENMTLE